ncbi:hypothetical protein KKF61_05255 [Patescibacteria group bacterium]|nr:hypothetical protein [Patescibacteria group bacterium]MBU0963713.1 hypothetical protein [Patescibacteria group bacterium]
MTPSEVSEKIAKIMRAMIHGRATKSFENDGEERQLFRAVVSLHSLLLERFGPNPSDVREAQSVDKGIVSGILDGIKALMSKVVYLDESLLLSGVTAGWFYDFEDL